MLTITGLRDQPLAIVRLLKLDRALLGGLSARADFTHASARAPAHTRPAPRQCYHRLAERQRQKD